MTAVHRLVERARRRLQVSELLEVATLAFPVAGVAMLAWIVLVRVFLRGGMVTPIPSLAMVGVIGSAMFLAYASWLLARRGWPTQAGGAT